MPSRTSGTSRRRFLSGAAAASAYVWIPKPVHGYTAAEMRAMADGANVKPGISKWELDTPALCVDLDKMEKNVATMQAALKKYGFPAARTPRRTSAPPSRSIRSPPDRSASAAPSSAKPRRWSPTASTRS